MPKWRVRVLLPAVSLCMTMVPWNGSLKSITHFTLLITIITRQVVKRIHMVFGDGIFWLGCWVKILGFKMVLARRLLGGRGWSWELGGGMECLLYTFVQITHTSVNTEFILECLTLKKFISYMFKIWVLSSSVDINIKAQLLR